MAPKSPTPQLLHCCIHPHGHQEAKATAQGVRTFVVLLKQCRRVFTLSCPYFIAVFLRVQIKRRLNLCVTQESLHGLGFDLRLVHQGLLGNCFVAYIRVAYLFFLCTAVTEQRNLQA
jgi:hypothetical protein